MIHKHQLYNEHATLDHPSADDTDIKSVHTKLGQKLNKKYQKVPVELTITIGM